MDELAVKENLLELLVKSGLKIYDDAAENTAEKINDIESESKDDN